MKIPNYLLICLFHSVFVAKGAIYYITTETVIFLRVKISCFCPWKIPCLHFISFHISTNHKCIINFWGGPYDFWGRDSKISGKNNLQQFHQKWEPNSITVETLENNSCQTCGSRKYSYPRPPPREFHLGPHLPGFSIFWRNWWPQTQWKSSFSWKKDYQSNERGHLRLRNGFRL